MVGKLWNKVAERLTSLPEWMWNMLLLGTLIIVFWVPRGLSLDQFVTTDERLWLSRSANFYCALSQGNWENTFQSEHPGVTTMYAGALGMQWYAPAYRVGCTDVADAKDHEATFRDQGLDPLELLAGGRFVMVVSITIIFGISFLYGRHLMGTTLAVIGFLLLAFDPFYTAHSRLLHLDGMLSSLMLLSVLSFLCYLKGRRARDFVVSGVTAGLSWLTKSPGLFLLPFIGLLLFDWFIKERVKHWSPGSMRRGGHALWLLLVWLGVASLVFWLMWPAMWLHPFETLSRVMSKTAVYATSGHDHTLFFNGTVVNDGKLDSNFYYFYPLTYLWRITPTVLIGVTLALIGMVGKGVIAWRRPVKSCSGLGMVYQTGAWLVVFGSLFTVSMTLGLKKFDRYLLPIYPALDLVAGLGWGIVAQWLQGRSKLIGKLSAWKLGSRALLSVAIVTQVALSVGVAPYYLSYYNPLLGGSRKAPEVMMIGWGEGLDQAARYLNALPNAERLKVLSWYNPACFSFFFKGYAEKISGEYGLGDYGEHGGLGDFDYAVIYIHQWQQRRPQALLNYLATQQPEHSIWINGLEYARIYNLRRYWDFYRAASFQEVEVTLDREILLEGYDLPQRRFTPGDVISLALGWRALETQDEQFKVFVHLMDQDNRLVSQSDSDPMAGLYPTYAWPEGEQIPDHYLVPVPENLSVGVYSLWVGMYRLSGERLLLTRDGIPIGDELSLGTVEIVP